jgi:hypothetical protein
MLTPLWTCLGIQGKSSIFHYYFLLLDLRFLGSTLTELTLSSSRCFFALNRWKKVFLRFFALAIVYSVRRKKCNLRIRNGHGSHGNIGIWGRCYDRNFLRFSPIFGEKIGVFHIQWYKIPNQTIAPMSNSSLKFGTLTSLIKTESMRKQPAQWRKVAQSGHPGP